MNTLLAALVLVHAAVDKAPDPEDVKPGWLGFGVFLALAVAVVLLWLSMRRQLKKVDFEVPGDGPRSARPVPPRAPAPRTPPKRSLRSPLTSPALGVGCSEDGRPGGTAGTTCSSGTARPPSAWC